MSDHLHININVELYDRADMAFDQRGDLLAAACQDAVLGVLLNEGFHPKDFFLNSGYV